jgi:hypothetical protein
MGAPFSMRLPGSNTQIALGWVRLIALLFVTVVG